ncbi:MAG TPA: MBL fold metallo-hydrolase [Ruminococcaceae bacterium]|jgi:glyoxylase-like metal-dependent hydrolase (beta-lactamase superfamily II)|nr:MBL fold metallo-hydrolase [Oscillospiraceae bacterium]HCA72020.1 MBL fold metallo-hydrolase [Oscillospiraceae bacterium]HCC01897.1 MBL fold metallo-hydrolase [Oscillospiraceae bacterium]HCM23090.1 MBL fold metallo-hydrolase [Oscillospiraceae bacterium]
MQIQKIPGGPLPTNCYLLTDDKTKETAVIDPGFFDSKLEKAVKQNHVKMVLLTHGHFDHITGVSQVVSQTGAKIYMDEKEHDFPSNPVLNLSNAMGLGSIPPFVPDVLLRDGDSIELGSLKIKVMHTPGHTCGGCCYLVENALFSGDTVMCGTVGRTDFPTGSYQDILRSAQKLGALPGNYRVLPGHEFETTLDWERKNNPYMGTEK